MSEAIDYHMFVKFKTKESADKFAEREDVEDFFDDVSVDDDISIEASVDGGWRGGGKSCLEVMKEAIGAALEEFRDDIIEFRASAEYIESPPTDNFELDDFVGKKLEAHRQ